MKTNRHEMILKLVQEKIIDTQESLRAALEENGMNVTQATLSRDIKELSLIKVSDEFGNSRYSVPNLSREGLRQDNNETLTLLHSAVIKVDHAINTVVIKCHVGMAQAVCAKLDGTHIENSVGTIAGDDTIFMLMRTQKDAERLVRELNSILYSKDVK
ncbi:arginine repressor [Ruminococcus sp.]|uniref:arginine repressor n=1 Tax=Ruminococcus sp. TaxID=41978 RepID=UPI0025F89988|nr:arginine repressor [Ruminococcus sp.]MBQ8965235.1 arginine repressor [Ruminococcus sp.]